MTRALVLSSALLSAVTAAYANPPGEPLQALADPRIQSVVYSPTRVIEVPVRRGVVTNITLPDDDTISVAPATGVGADCSRETDPWCVASTGRDLFVKPRAGATTNNLIVIGERRRYAFQLSVGPARAAQPAISRLNIVTAPLSPSASTAAAASAAAAPGPSAADLVAARLRHEPQVRNAEYSVAVGEGADDLVPTLVFDDGAKTYFAFPNNRPLPAVFQTLPDGGEEMVNVLLDERSGLLSADRVARRFVLRQGGGVVAILNDRFDLDGVAPVDGTLIPGVRRVMRVPPVPPSDASAAPEGDSR